MTDTTLIERPAESEASVMEAGNAAFQRLKEHRKLFRRDWVPFSKAVILLSDQAWEHNGQPETLDGRRDWTSIRVQDAFNRFIDNLPWSDYFTNRTKLLSAIRSIGSEPGGLDEGGAFLKWFDELPEDKRDIIGHPETLWQLYQKHKKAEPKAGDPPKPNGDPPYPNDDADDDDDDDEPTKPERQEDRERRQLREQIERLIQEKEDTAVKWAARAKEYGPAHVASGIAWLRTMIKETDSSDEFPLRWHALLEAPEAVATPVTMVAPKKRKATPKAKAKANTKVKAKKAKTKPKVKATVEP
jgi:hypothetical protein